MFFIKRVKIRTWEIGLLFRDGEFKGKFESTSCHNGNPG